LKVNQGVRELVIYRLCFIAICIDQWLENPVPDENRIKMTRATAEYFLTM
jgi:hypothetical protein